MKILKNDFLLSFIAGCLCTIAFAPFNFFIMAVVSISLFYLILERNEAKKNIFWVGFAYGFGYFLTGVYWIAISLMVDADSFAWLIPFAVTLIPGALALYMALCALSYKFLVNRFNLNYVNQKIVVLALCWMFFEILRSVSFSGFPWNLLGYVLMFSSYTMQSASIFGVYGMSFIALLICLFPVLFLHNQNKVLADKILAIIISVIFLANFFYGYLRISNTNLELLPTKLRLVQASIKQEIKWNNQAKYSNLLKHIDLTNQKSLEDINAVIWSETSVPYPIGDNSELINVLQQAIPPQGVLITGALRLKYKDDQKTEVSNIWNSIFSIKKDSSFEYYDKSHLVPFGEYIPLENYLPFIKKITDGSIGFSVGEGNKTLNSGSFLFSPLVCYEVIFSNKILNKKDQRPDLLVNLTNDTWFGNSSGPYQHFNMARMRAVEYGIPMARVANNGISAFIDPLGNSIKKLNLNQRAIIDVNLIKKLAPTVYEKYSYWPASILILLVLILSITANIICHARKNNTG